MNPLVDFLTQHLNGINAQQAGGAAGMILDLVRSQLNPEDFAQIKQVIPDAEQLAEQAPALNQGGGGLLGTLGSLASAMSGGEGLAGQLGKMASMADGMQKLGLSPEMLTQILPLVLQFAESQGGPQLKALIERALKA